MRADPLHAEPAREDTMAVIRTVFGDIAPDRAGVTLTHEHVRYAYAGC